MSLDVDLMVMQPVSVYSANITHNLGTMADNVVLSNGLTLYEVLWRPDDIRMLNFGGLCFGSDIAELLDEAWHILESEPETFKKFNPENGWGSYEGLMDFVYRYRNACLDNPDAEVRVCR